LDKDYLSLFISLFADKRHAENYSKDSSWGQTPLSRAAANRHEAVVRLLLAKNGVDPDSKVSRISPSISLVTGVREGL
jgi:ankyrin repeat protein